MKLSSILSALIFLLGAFTVYSSIYSVSPAVEYRYNQLTERSKTTPESVTAEEWVQSKDDEGMTALLLIIVGAVSFFIVTTGIFLTLMAKDCKKLSTLAFSFGSGWFVLGLALHALVWLV